MNIVSIPSWVRRFYKSALWKKETLHKEVYLTFDDGPTLGVTEKVLSLLNQYEAKATFFCIGSQVEKNKALFQKIQEEGHSVGNHTYNHLSGWSTLSDLYLKDVEKANDLIQSSLFRPPYGRIKVRQYRKLKKQYKVVFWDIIPGDFVKGITAKKVIDNILKNVRSGSIIVLHDSNKCAEILLQVLPEILEKLSTQGYKFTALQSEKILK